jgi:spore coat polysaccharide biosynthesis protein SpsF
LKYLVIIQARINSKRLKNKMFLDLHGYPVYEWVYRRVSMSKFASKVVFAIPDAQSDDIFAKALETIGAKVIRGNEHDLVDRFYRVAKIFEAENIVRVCADNPMICASEIDRLIDFFRENSCDYAYNHIPKNNFYPDGLGAEICTMNILEEIFIHSILREHREHVFDYIWSHSNNFNIQTFNPPNNLSYPNIKLDIDSIEDYNKLLKKPYKIDMSADEIIKITLTSHSN